LANLCWNKGREKRWTNYSENCLSVNGRRWNGTGTVKKTIRNERNVGKFLYLCMYLCMYWKIASTRSLLIGF
jgi:hypothetical protein